MIEDLKAKIESLDNSILELKNERFRLNEQYIEKMYNECQKNIGRCYKNTKGDYFMLIKTSPIVESFYGSSFNEYEYEALVFSYPYNQSRNPFTTTDINISGSINCSQITEIEYSEFVDKLLEVNQKWLLAILAEKELINNGRR